MVEKERKERVDGRSTRWIAHREKRRALLLSKARDVLAATGHEVAMDELASAMGTSKSILYRYFDDRGGLREALSQEVRQDLTARLVAEDLAGWGPEGDALTRIVEIFLTTVDEQPELFLFVDVGTGPDTQAAPFENTALEALGEEYEVLPPVHRAALIGTLHGVALRWLYNTPERSEQDIKDLAAQVSTWLRGGLLTAR